MSESTWHRLGDVKNCILKGRALPLSLPAVPVTSALSMQSCLSIGSRTRPPWQAVQPLLPQSTGAVMAHSVGRSSECLKALAEGGGARDTGGWRVRAGEGGEGVERRLICCMHSELFAEMERER